MTTFRPPRDCPVCADRLHITQLGCSNCGTGLSGRFEPCDFCGLDDADLDVLRVFLSSRGNMKDLERHLGVSYPTARSRFDDLLGRLGLAPRPADDPSPDGVGADAGSPPAPPVPPDPHAASGASRSAGAAAAGVADPRLAALEALAAGELGLAEARDAVDQTAAPTPPPSPERGRRRSRG